MRALDTVMVYGGRPPSLGAQLREVLAKRELLLAFVERDLKVRYKQTALGTVWAVLPSFLLMVVFSVFFGRFAKISSEGFPYPVFVYAGLLPWQFFSTAVSGATGSLYVHHNIISKVAFPREILPLFHIFSAGVDFLIALGIFAVLLLYYGIPISWTALFVVPLLLIEIVFIGSLGLIFSISNAYLRDVRYVVPFFLQVLMFSSPVVYSTQNVPEWLRPIYLVVNPMATIIDSFRQVILRRSMPDLSMLLVLTIVVSVLFVISYRVFKAAERNIADVV